jgi:RND family efflux transporter MFP subunit
VGTLVGANESTLLASMVDDDKVFVDFDVPELWIQRVRKSKEAKQDKGGIQSLVVQCALPTDEGFPHEGRGDYVAPAVDRNTGTLRVRAVFENAGRKLLTGSYVRVRFPLAQRKGALLLPRRAVSSDQAGDYVLVVDGSDTVKRADVVLGADHGKRVVILEGLKADDRVIVRGIQRARPGAKVTPELAKPEAPAPSGDAPAKQG